MTVKEFHGREIVSDETGYRIFIMEHERNLKVVLHGCDRAPKKTFEILRTQLDCPMDRGKLYTDAMDGKLPITRRELDQIVMVWREMVQGETKAEIPAYTPNPTDPDERPAVRIEVWCARCHAGLCSMTKSLEREGGRPVFLVEPHDCEGKATKLRELLFLCEDYISDIGGGDPRARKILDTIAAALPEDHRPTTEEKNG